ncbi:hypothetical protein ACLKA6_001781 [Drosophila palustris]
MRLQLKSYSLTSAPTDPFITTSLLQSHFRHRHQSPVTKCYNNSRFLFQCLVSTRTVIRHNRIQRLRRRNEKETQAQAEALAAKCVSFA